ncbi:2-(5''-triphosphoribosyl)-3'-dephosphocoenzyme-A synthase [Streptococcus pseudoporcinus]|uniref:Probable 2-(5''-triphosphoribosyl)-3'-dephosphocoenzyme-A synthase n=1 Tax=Streptococcus pseudoporcinus TaxID=361101 RepID=A0A4U9XNE1_9STRE|nr:triphosphoribosyl-dephospho-CoA synthase CitG [Streptococcus pseudoporcinus]VTS14275.1 2-(5''-triphosphoribosyl)-3'-dephosphocoenzyme-A synthase [Streptococcus pseudoporcinus]
MNSKEKIVFFSQLATKALLYEVTLTPKPGLVDSANNGSHADMTLTTFLDSTLALAPHFQRYVELGYKHHQKKPQELFNLLRHEGISAEQAMFQATNGINTHKGVNFSFALLLGSTGAHLAKHPELLHNATFTAMDSQAICQAIVPMTSHLIEMDLGDLQSKTELTYGEKLYLHYGIKGPRGEASQGYPSVWKKALPYLRQLARLEMTSQERQLRLLVFLMTFVEDANLIHRASIEDLYQVQADSRMLLKKATDFNQLLADLERYNYSMVERNLSPGGSADLLALTFYFAFLEKLL